MSPLARSLLALALAALLRGACALHYFPIQQHQPPALPGEYCDELEIGNATVTPSHDGSVRVTQVFNTKLRHDEYLINIINYCSNLRSPPGKLGVQYVMTRETVKVCANTPVHVLDSGENVFSPVAAVCELAEECGKVRVKVDQHCEVRVVVPNQRSEYA